MNPAFVSPAATHSALGRASPMTSSLKPVSALHLRDTAFLPPSPRAAIHYAAPHAATPANVPVVHMSAITPETARIGIAVYGVLVAGGGIGAFLRSGSKPSVISGVTAGVVLGIAYVKESVPAALATAIVLSIVFAIRLAKTKKFMPAGFLCILSVLAAAFFALSIYG